MKPKTIFRKCQMKVKTEKYCLSCKHAYIQPETGYGYCKYPNNIMSIKIIEELDSCKSWEKKNGN